jgi:DUF917 family protein
MATQSLLGRRINEVQHVESGNFGRGRALIDGSFDGSKLHLEHQNQK